MPLHVHPHLRTLEEAREAAGVIIALDSVAVTQFLAAEAAGTQTKQIPPITVVAHGKSYKAK